MSHTNATYKADFKRILETQIDNEMPTRCLRLEGDDGQFTLLNKDHIKEYLGEKINKEDNFLENKLVAAGKQGISSQDALQHIAADMCSYSILSHTWIDDKEIKFENTRETAAGIRTLPDGLRTGEAYNKLARFCAVSCRTYKVEFAWADTICIDKVEPELSASIRSMFKWYSKAAICIVYLAQTTCPSTNNWDDVAKDKWFTRGWTLQELLAPQHISFYDKNWKELGSHSKHPTKSVSLLQESNIGKSILTATGISAADICGFQGGIGQTDVATRMRWMCRRVTKYEEDKVYSVMGIFDVDIPVIYGTGLHDAFFRLMEAIVTSNRNRNILSVFNFGGPSTPTTSLLPRDFTGYELERSNPRMNYINDAVPQDLLDLSSSGLSMNVLVVLARIVRARSTPGSVFLEILQNKESAVWFSPIKITVNETLPNELNIHSQNIYSLGIWSFRDRGAEVELPTICSAFLFAYSARTPCPQGVSVWNLPEDAISHTTKVDTDRVIVLKRRRYYERPVPEDQSGHRRLVTDLRLLKVELPYHGMAYKRIRA